MSVLLTLLVAVNCVGNACWTFEGYVPMFAEEGRLEAEIGAMPAAAVPKGEPWQRLDQDYSNNPNASMILDYAGTASYFSTSNGNTARFLHAMELPLHNKVLFPDLDSRAALNAVLDTRWFAANGQGGRSVPFGFEPVQEGLWEDEGVLPLGFTYDTILSEERWSELGPLERQEMMLRVACVQGVPEKGEMPASCLRQVELTGHRAQQADWDGGQINAYAPNAELSVEFSGLPESETYLRLRNVALAWGEEPQLSVTVRAGQSERRYTFSSEHFLWHSGQESVLLHLGYHPQGLDGAQLMFEQPGGLRLDGLEIWCQPMDYYENWRSELRRESLTDLRVQTDRITGAVTVTGRRVMAFAIPYSPGWTVRVDGQNTQTLKVNDFLLGVELEAGEHTVELRYRSPGFAVGLLLSGAGLCGLGAMLLYRRKDRKAA